jgi:saccharopine dehydrogenase-like NADP-dependent oxidoreductase
MRDRRLEAGEILVNAKPPVDDGVVYVHVSAEGIVDGRLSRREFVKGYRPVTLVGKQCTAIAWTTASSVVAVIEMVRDGALQGSGFLKQEDIKLDAFLATRAGAIFAA